MDLMKENTDGKMEFPRDIAMHDCFSGTAEPLWSPNHLMRGELTSMVP